jgi:hypothetical protein
VAIDLVRKAHIVSCTVCSLSGALRDQLCDLITGKAFHHHDTGVLPGKEAWSEKSIMVLSTNER